MTDNGAVAESAMTIDRPQALRVIEALRTGRNCLEAVSAFSAGRALLLRAAGDLFGELDISGGAVVRWVKGRVGQGKTHFFARLIEMALQRNWVSSYVLISEPQGGTELHRFEEVYASIVRNCICSGLIATEGGKVDPGHVAGWDWIMEDWWLRLRRQVIGRESGEVPTLRMQEAINQAVTGMRRRFSVHGSFAEAVRQFALSRADGDDDWTEVMRAWFRGEDVHSRGGDVKARLLQCGIRESLHRRNSKEMLRSLSVFLRYLGYGGMLVLIDELENVLQQTARARKNAYTTLRELIDNVDDRHGMTHTALYISATPDVFDSERGLTEHEALASRVLLPAGQALNPVGAVVDLGIWPLGRTELTQIAQGIAHLHSTAKVWQIPPAVVVGFAGLLDSLLAGNPDLSTRDWVKSVVWYLDSEHGKSRK
jgi:hypothetical protein